MWTLIPTEIKNKCVAIVKFGPAGFQTDGFAPGEYYQVTLDPTCVSKSGEYIRFGHNPGDEIHGWQRIMALSVVEILADWEDPLNPPKVLTGHDSFQIMRLEEI